MFFELPFDDGIVRIDDIERVELGTIEETDIELGYDEDGPDTHFIIIYMKKGSYCTQYEYTYLSREAMYNALAGIRRGLNLG